MLSKRLIYLEKVKQSADWGENCRYILWSRLVWRSLLRSTLWLEVRVRVSPHTRTDGFPWRDEHVWPNPLSPLLKWIFPSCQRVKSGFAEYLAYFSLTVGFLSPYVQHLLRLSLPLCSTAASLWVPSQHRSGKWFTFHLAAHTNLLRLDTVLGPRCNSHVPAEKIYH